MTEFEQKVNWRETQQYRLLHMRAPCWLNQEASEKVMMVERLKDTEYQATFFAAGSAICISAFSSTRRA